MSDAFDDWWNETEAFSGRWERAIANLGPDCEVWLRAAFRQGLAVAIAEADRCKAANMELANDLDDEVLRVRARGCGFVAGRIRAIKDGVKTDE